MLGTRNEKSISAYQPTREVKDITAQCRDDFQVGLEILQTPYVELNDMSVLDRKDRDQRTFNAFVDENIEDPNEAWKWRGTRSKARNKAIAMHAKITTGYIQPMFMAQNDDDEVDEDFSNLMQDGTEWMINNSSYKSSYLMVTMGMLVNPVTYLGAEYLEVFQTIKEKTESGYTKREILDEVNSGFQAPVYSADQILISNAYEQNIQRQRTIQKVRWIEYNEAQQIYGEHENWDYVTPGINTSFNSEDGTFYDTVDDEHPNLVQEVIYLDRINDVEIPFVGGIYLGESDVENSNAIKHRDNRNRPKYNVVPFGYQRINEHFYFYKSLMNAQYWDNQLLDSQYEMGMNRMFLDANMPIAVSGSDKIDSEIIFPSSVVAFSDKDTKVTPLLQPANINGIFSAMSIVEQSLEESSVSDVASGQLPNPNTKATALNISESNAKIMLQGVGKTLGESMVQYGNLMADIFLNHISTAQVDEIVGESTRIKYRTLTLKDKVVDGKTINKVLKFDKELLGLELTDEQIKKANIQLAMESGYPENKSVIFRINPELCAKFKYLARIEPTLMFPKNEEYYQALMMQLTQQMAQNPYASLEALTRETFQAFFKSKAEGFMKNPEEMQQQGVQLPQSTAGSMAQNNALSKQLVPSA